jgi:hypothetical protein
MPIVSCKSPQRIPMTKSHGWRSGNMKDPSPLYTLSWHKHKNRGRAHWWMKAAHGCGEGAHEWEKGAYDREGARTGILRVHIRCGKAYVQRPFLSLSTSLNQRNYVPKQVQHIGYCKQSFTLTCNANCYYYSFFTITGIESYITLSFDFFCVKHKGDWTIGFNITSIIFIFIF